MSVNIIPLISVGEGYMSIYQKGSEWRKWDLHIHSTYSLEPKAKLRPKDIFEAASVNDIAVISITDHSNVDGLDESWDVWENGISSNGKKFSDNITFFPGVELKANLGTKGVHFIAVFPPSSSISGYDQKVDKTFLKDAFFSKIGCGKSDINATGEGNYQKGLFTVAVDLKVTADLVRSIGGVIIVHNGNKHSSLEEELDHPSQYALPDELLNTLGPQKKKLMLECVDFCELPNWNSYHKKQSNFYFDTFRKPSVVFSDSHDSYVNSCPTWIKADPTFEGLKQILNEPQDRVCIEKPPVILEKIQSNKTNIIKSVSIKPIGNTKGWFNETILLNSSLIAIIGNKGTGKSALADVISLLGNTKQTEKFSFLESKKFRNKKTGKASLFHAEMTWLDGDISGPVNLNANPTKGSFEKVKYLPQNFIDEVCSDLSATQDNMFYQELQGVIFSHLQDHENLGCDSLSELLENKTEETEQQIQNKIEKIEKINYEIIQLQHKQSQEFRVELENKLAEKIRSVRQIKIDKPHRKPNPSLVEKSQEQQKIIDDIAKTQERVDKLTTIKEEFTRQRVLVSQKIASTNKLSEKLTWVEEKIKEFRKDIDELAIKIGINTEDIFQTTINNRPIQFQQKYLLEEQKSLDRLLDTDIENSIEWELKPSKKSIEQFKEALSKPEKDYQEFLQNRKKWKKSVLDEFGTKIAPQKGTIRKLKSELKQLKKIPQSVEDLEQERRKLVQEVYKLKNALKEKFRSLHAPVQRFISDHPIALREKFPLSFLVRVAEESFADTFFGYISKGVNGSFCGTEQGQKRLEDILERTDFDDEASTLVFLDEILASLREDKRDGQEIAIEKQLKKNTSEEELLNMIFSLSYLKPVYNLQWDGKSVDQLSPGERGQLLLIFYLLIDQSNIPLIIDQPEENLDNQTVYQVLVPCIKEAKEKRQVVLVTHNPNLAVVCDAEQIICVNMDKKNENKITYTSGAIENPVINKKIVEILEGTEPAFNVRKSKYQFINK
jgi:ABC-type lipoprotein export system ATPase subunit